MDGDEANLRPCWPQTIEIPLGIQMHGPDFGADAQMLIALGAVVRAASKLEFGLRGLFCALEASKFACITAAGQSVGWLLEMSNALLARRQDISEEHRARLAALLADARDAIEKRNRYVHDVWAGGTDGSPQLLRSHRRRHELSSSSVALEGLIETSRVLTECHVRIEQWIWVALGADSVSIEAQLRWEDHLRSLSPAELGSLAEQPVEHEG